MGRAMRQTPRSREMKHRCRANRAGSTDMDIVRGTGRPLPFSPFRGGAHQLPEVCESEDHQ